MSEMVERVARKLEPKAWAALGTGDTLAYANRRTSSLRKAVLVIKEMREPTQVMIDAVDLSGDHPTELVIERAWQAMIDTALKD